MQDMFVCNKCFKVLQQLHPLRVQWQAILLQAVWLRKRKWVKVIKNGRSETWCERARGGSIKYKMYTTKKEKKENKRKVFFVIFVQLNELFNQVSSRKQNATAIPKRPSPSVAFKLYHISKIQFITLQALINDTTKKENNFFLKDPLK